METPVHVPLVSSADTDSGGAEILIEIAATPVDGRNREGTIDPNRELTTPIDREDGLPPTLHVVKERRVSSMNEYPMDSWLGGSTDTPGVTVDGTQFPLYYTPMEGASETRFSQGDREERASGLTPSLPPRIASIFRPRPDEGHVATEDAPQRGQWGSPREVPSEDIHSSFSHIPWPEKHLSLWAIDEDYEDVALVLVADITYKTSLRARCLERWAAKLEGRQSRQRHQELLAAEYHARNIRYLFFRAWQWRDLRRQRMRQFQQRAELFSQKKLLQRTVRGWSAYVQEKHRRCEIVGAMETTIEEGMQLRAFGLWFDWMRRVALAKALSRASGQVHCESRLGTWLLFIQMRQRQRLVADALSIYNPSAWHSSLNQNQDAVEGSRNRIRYNQDPYIPTAKEDLLRSFAWLQWLRATCVRRCERLHRYEENVAQLQHSSRQSTRLVCWQRWLLVTTSAVQARQRDRQLRVAFFQKWRVYSTLERTAASFTLHCERRTLRSSLLHWRQLSLRRRTRREQQEVASKFYHECVRAPAICETLNSWRAFCDEKRRLRSLAAEAERQRLALLQHLACERLVEGVLFTKHAVEESRRQSENRQLLGSDAQRHVAGILTVPQTLSRLSASKEQPIQLHFSPPRPLQHHEGEHSPAGDRFRERDRTPPTNTTTVEKEDSHPHSMYPVSPVSAKKTDAATQTDEGVDTGREKGSHAKREAKQRRSSRAGKSLKSRMKRLPLFLRGVAQPEAHAALSQLPASSSEKRDARFAHLPVTRPWDNHTAPNELHPEYSSISVYELKVRGRALLAAYQQMKEGEVAEYEELIRIELEQEQLLSFMSSLIEHDASDGSSSSHEGDPTNDADDVVADEARERLATLQQRATYLSLRSQQRGRLRRHVEELQKELSTRLRQENVVA